ncbi:MAG: hypothetical protein ACRDKG_07115 [Actinomycetota bacterium]
MAANHKSSGKVIGAYEDPEVAHTAEKRARNASAGAVVHPPTKADEVASLRSEMREEVRHTIMGPGNIGPFTKEMTKGLAKTIPAATIAGAVLLIPFAFIPVADYSLALRLVVAIAVGAAAGAVAGFVIGGGAQTSEKEPGTMAAERGTLVVADLEEPESAARVAEAMADNAIRVDVVTEDEVPIGDVTTEEEQERKAADRETKEQAKERAEVLKDPSAR